MAENTEKFLDLKEEEFKKFDYLSDKSTRLKDEILAGTFNNGLNFINLYKAIAKNSNKNNIDNKNMSNLNFK